MTTEQATRGRPRSIPTEHFVTINSLRERGLGYRSIANELIRLGVPTSRGSVERFLKRLPPYDTDLRIED